MKPLFLSCALFAASVAIASAGEPQLKSILGDDLLAFWVAPEGNTEAKWWSVENGILKVQSGPEQKGSILNTKKDYKDFVMEFDFKFGEGIVDSGVLIRNGKDQIQIGISGSLKRDMTGSPYIPGKGYPVEAEGVAELLKLKDWNQMRIKAVGKTYTVWLNGKQVLDYTSDTAGESGPLGIQLHGKRDMSIEYRNIRAADLK